MALFEEELLDLDENAGKEENSYLKDPVKGLRLVQAILHRQNRNMAASGETGIRSKVSALLAGLELEGEAEFYQRLTRLDSRMKEQERVSLLDGKVVLGIGGRFSSGKSCFINSITDASLP